MNNKSRIKNIYKYFTKADMAYMKEFLAQLVFQICTVFLNCIRGPSALEATRFLSYGWSQRTRFRYHALLPAQISTF